MGAKPIEYEAVAEATLVPLVALAVTLAVLLCLVMTLGGWVNVHAARTPEAPAVPVAVLLVPFGKRTVMRTVAAGRVLAVTVCFFPGARLPCPSFTVTVRGIAVAVGVGVTALPGAGGGERLGPPGGGGGGGGFCPLTELTNSSARSAAAIDATSFFTWLPFEQ